MFSQGMCPREWWWSEEVERNKQSLQLYILSSLTQTMLEPHTSDKCPLQLFCQQLKQEVPHTHTRFHAVGSLLMISEYLWWLNWNGFSCSGWLRACQAQQELLNVVTLVNLVKVWSPLKFNEGWGDPVIDSTGAGLRSWEMRRGFQGG